MMKRQLFVVVAVVGSVVLAGCEGGGSTSSAGTSSRSTTSASAAPVVPPAPVLNRRADNGEIVQQDGLSGAGTLRIDNGNSADFAVVVTNGNPAAPQAIIYVQGNSEATLSGIDGTYYVYLKTGTDWDQATLGFTRDRKFQKFDDPFDAGSDWEITLQPSIGGNASTSSVPAF
ncbi:Uncharacterised protein [Nocardia asteroides]|nr:hypothetical protein SAMN05444423_10347 [Nocardia asteroides]VEG33605.1 Uncharacterised protein [Nocardia asteroides]